MCSSELTRELSCDTSMIIRFCFACFDDIYGDSGGDDDDNDDDGVDDDYDDNCYMLMQLL